MIFEILGLVALGFTSSIIAYLLGVGGGALIVPVMVVFFGYQIHEAIAVSLVVIVASSLSITSVNLIKNMVNIRFALHMELAAILGAVSGGLFSVNMSETVLSTMFAGIMIVTAVIMWKKSEVKGVFISEEDACGEFDKDYLDSRSGKIKYYQVQEPNKTAFIAILAGLVSGMLGLGGGVFKVPAMNIISKLPIKAATATSNFMICFTAAAGAIPYILNGHLHPAATSSMVLGVVIGSKFATQHLNKVQNKNIKLLFVVFLILVATQMLFKAVS
jgi:uncharacterized membrane protein YfcA